MAGALLPAGMAAMNISVAALTVAALVRVRLPGSASVAGYSSPLRGYLLAWLVYIAVMVVSAVSNGLDLSALSMIKGQLLFLVVLPAAFVFAEPTLHRRYVDGLVLGLLVMSLYTLFQLYAPKLLPFVLHRPHRFHAGAFDNALTWTAVLYVGFSLWISAREQRRLRWQVLVAVTLLTIWVVTLGERTYSAVAVLLWLAFLGIKSWRAMLVCLCAAAVLVALAWPYVSDGKKQRYAWEELSGGKSTKVRRHLWHMALDMAAQSPVLGVGPGHFADALVERQGSKKPYYFRHAHSNYLHSLAETGVAGLVGLLVLQFQWLAAIWRASHRHRLWWGFSAALFLVLGGITEANWIDSEVVILGSLLTASILARSRQEAS